jgi:hypothetical protein
MVGDVDSATATDGRRVDLRRMADRILDRHYHALVARAATDLSKTHTRKLAVTEPPDEPLVVQARRGDTGELLGVDVHGIRVNVSVEVVMHHDMKMLARLFDKTPALYGETAIDGNQAVFVVTEEAGTTRATLRTRRPGQGAPEDWQYDGVIEIETPDE